MTCVTSCHCPDCLTIDILAYSALWCSCAVCAYIPLCPQVFHYMHKYGLPDETCMLYSATDHTKYKGARPTLPVASSAKQPCQALSIGYLWGALASIAPILT